MEKKHQTALMWFRQDLRTFDNTALYHAVEESVSIIPIFIFDTDILEHFSQGLARIGFLMDAVKQLDQELRAKGSELYIFHGKPADIIPKLIKEYSVDALYCNKSYGQGAITRDSKIKGRCYNHGVVVNSYSDFLMLDVDIVKQMKVYTPFYNRRQKHVDQKDLQTLSVDSIQTPKLEKHPGNEKVLSEIKYEKNTYRPVENIQNKLNGLRGTHYVEQRNIPGIDGTTKLSPYIRFGLLSTKQIYLHLKKEESKGSQTIIKELARREFRQHIHYHFPETRDIEFQEKRRHITRDNNKEFFTARKEGRTGYPIIDAGMRQLREENRMHNRVRMVVASFLTKDLLIDRRRGEAHFADHLLDYDKNVNFGNRQRSSSVGADPKPLRIFNPILQSERFDPKADYIFKYIPELKGQPLKAIHDPLKYKLDYHEPIVDHYEWRLKTKEAYYASQ